MGGAAMLTAGYIDVNPVKAKIVSGIENASDYRWGSYHEACGGDADAILWHKLGSKTDYEGEDYAGSLAGFVRSLVGLDQAAVNEKFGQYLTGTVFNSNQQEFVKMVINYVRENGEITRNDLVNSYPFKFLHSVQLFGDKMPILLDVIAELEKLLPKAA